MVDEAYLLAAARHIELNPVRAQLVRQAADWSWSSARAHLCGEDDRVVEVAPLLAMVPDWNAFLQTAVPVQELAELRRHVHAGRPLGNETLVGRLEEMVGRVLGPKKRGPKPKNRAN